MTARAEPKLAVRPFLAGDTPVLSAIFRAAIEELTEDDYNPAQQDAWAATADDEELFGERLAAQLTVIATLEGSPVGFISLKDGSSIDLLYVHPAVAGQGVGSTLYDAIERLAASRGAAQLTVEASDTAREFFQSRGFTAEQRNTTLVGNEWISNTSMKKHLPGPAPCGSSSNLRVSP
jgi:putative acetyltransferase